MRSIVYPWDLDQSALGAQGTDLEKPARLFGRQAAEEPISAPVADGYSSKIVKYIPAEVIAFYVPAYAIADTNAWRWFVLGLAIIGCMLYVWIRSHEDLAGQRPIYFYLLSLVALLAWALGTSTVGQDLAGISANASKLLLTAGVFMVPLADQAITRVRESR